MTADALCRAMGLDLETMKFKDYPGVYRPEDVIVNYPIFIPGIKALDDEQWMYAVTKVQKEKLYHKLIIGDELNSILLARNSRDISQADFANFVWKMPKRDCLLLYTNNMITGVDLIIRDGTWCTILPHGCDDYIEYCVIHNYEMRTDEGLRFTGVKQIQELFDSYS